MAKLGRASKMRRAKTAHFSNIFVRVHAHRGRLSLARSAAILGLTKTDTGQLFGVTRQAIDNWYKQGIPMNRVADVDRIADVARALHARFVPERIPHIAHASLPGLNGRTILEAIRINGTQVVLNMLDRAFAYLPEQ